jgi:3-phosphoshikimate 1-carboxyvinyltransferase
MKWKSWPKLVFSFLLLCQMQAVIYPGNIHGAIAAPPSKSATQRALAASLLYPGITHIHHHGRSSDELAALQIIRNLGATIMQTEIGLRIQSSFPDSLNRPITIHCGESGLAARLFAPIAALASRPVTITGSGTLLKRPMKDMEIILPQLGVKVGAVNGCLPITVQGPLHAKNIVMDGSASSQYLTGLLIALAFSAQEPVTIQVEHLKSAPYIALTIDILQQYGITVEHDAMTTFHIAPFRPAQVGEVTIAIEGDWSGAANWLVGAAIGGSVRVHNLMAQSSQADRAVVAMLRKAGAHIKENEQLIAVHQAPLHSFEVDATHCPDLFPILAVLAANCNGASAIRGVHRLAHKESNRLESISQMMAVFGIAYTVSDDCLIVTGGPIRSTGDIVIDPHLDHRIAMAAAICALKAERPVTIIDAECVNKSYPDFFRDLSLCGVHCELHE